MSTLAEALRAIYDAVPWGEPPTAEERRGILKAKIANAREVLFDSCSGPSAVRDAGFDALSAAQELMRETERTEP